MAMKETEAQMNLQKVDIEIDATIISVCQQIRNLDAKKDERYADVVDAVAQLNEADLACSKPKPYGRMIKTREGGERIGCREEDLPAINPGALHIEPQM